jgi:hypothetical protein
MRVLAPNKPDIIEIACQSTNPKVAMYILRQNVLANLSRQEVFREALVQLSRFVLPSMMSWFDELDDAQQHTDSPEYCAWLKRLQTSSTTELNQLLWQFWECLDDEAKRERSSFEKHYEDDLVECNADMSELLDALLELETNVYWEAVDGSFESIRDHWWDTLRNDDLDDGVDEPSFLTPIAGTLTREQLVCIRYSTPSLSLFNQCCRLIALALQLTALAPRLIALGGQQAIYVDLHFPNPEKVDTALLAGSTYGHADLVQICLQMWQYFDHSVCHYNAAIVAVAADQQFSWCNVCRWQTWRPSWETTHSKPPAAVLLPQPIRCLITPTRNAQTQTCSTQQTAHCARHSLVATRTWRRSC